MKAGRTPTHQFEYRFRDKNDRVRVVDVLLNLDEIGRQLSAQCMRNKSGKGYRLDGGIVAKARPVK